MHITESQYNALIDQSNKTYNNIFESEEDGRYYLDLVVTISDNKKHFIVVSIKKSIKEYALFDNQHEAIKQYNNYIYDYINGRIASIE
jgi:hypothetical protein